MRVSEVVAGRFAIYPSFESGRSVAKCEYPSAAYRLRREPTAWVHPATRTPTFARIRGIGF